MTLDSVKTGTCRFMDTEIMTKTCGLSKWIVGAMITAIPGLIDRKFTEVKQMLETAGIVNEAGDIDIHKAEDMLVGSASKYGAVDVNLAGTKVRLSADDVRKLAYYIKESN